jgi:hypothetical protein
MTCRDRHDKLAVAAAEKLQILVRQLMGPFTVHQISNVHQDWLEAERELQRFRDWFRETGASRGDEYPAQTQDELAENHIPMRMT